MHGATRGVRRAALAGLAAAGLALVPVTADATPGSGLKAL